MVVVDCGAKQSACPRLGNSRREYPSNIGWIAQSAARQKFAGKNTPSLF
jgi:hypothetical protein